MATSDDTQNIIITGFMGTGKTTVGRLVASHLDWPFIDTDALIEHETGMNIPDIFAQHGEAYFRAQERQLAQRLTTRHQQVIATGGGMLIDAETRGLMIACGLVICLTADAETIQTRIDNDRTGRPLAPHWQELLVRRLPVYALLPHHISTSGRLPEDIAQEVIALWRARH